MSTLLEPFQYEFFQRALIVATITGALCGLIGVYVVLRGMSYIGHGLSHAIFGGAVASYVVGVSVFLGAALWGLVAALFINKVARRRSIGADAAIGAITSASFAIGIILISVQGTFVVNFEALLWGNVLGVAPVDVLVVAAVALGTALFVFFGYRGRSDRACRHRARDRADGDDRRHDERDRRDDDRGDARDPAGDRPAPDGLVLPDALDLGGRRNVLRLRRRIRLVLPELVLGRHGRAHGVGALPRGVRAQRVAPPGDPGARRRGALTLTPRRTPDRVR
jgi:hypothetical protein